MLDETFIRLLTEGAQSFGLELSERERTRFSVYIEELQRWSVIANLVSQNNTETLICKHLIDSLAVIPLLPQGHTLLDLGSGAGFPGLVVAIVRPSWTVFLIEARRKRANFLKQVIRKAALDNVTVHEGRAEELATDTTLQSSCDVVMTRATWNLAKFVQLADPFVSPHGSVVAMKGPEGKAELQQTKPSLQKLDYRMKRVEEYLLPFSNNMRQLIILAKECST